MRCRSMNLDHYPTMSEQYCWDHISGIIAGIISGITVAESKCDRSKPKYFARITYVFDIRLPVWAKPLNSCP